MAWEKEWEKALRGPVAVVDCREEIPCDPCEKACARGAIKVGEDICSPPEFDPDACDGCGRCVAVCPGMAVFLLDRGVGGGRARVTVPFEMEEEMTVGDRVLAMDAGGGVVCECEVVARRRMGSKDKTLLVTVEVPEKAALKVRGVRNRRLLIEEPEEVEGPSRQEDFPFCRCEEISYERIREIMDMGFHAFTALRRFSRVGLGICQGRFCEDMLREEFAARSSRTAGDVGTFKARPPVRPVKMSRLGGKDE